MIWLRNNDAIGETLSGGKQFFRSCAKVHSKNLSRFPVAAAYVFPFLAVPVSHQVKQEVWDALLKRYGYKEVTDMLAMLHSASVIRRAITAMRRRKWTRNFARIDPELVEKADRLRRIQVFKRADY